MSVCMSVVALKRMDRHTVFFVFKADVIEMDHSRHRVYMKICSSIYKVILFVINVSRVFNCLQFHLLAIFFYKYIESCNQNKVTYSVPDNRFCSNKLIMLTKSYLL